MTEWADKLFVYQINTWVWLNTLSCKYEQTIRLENVPDEVLDELAKPGIDFIWLMGVWTRNDKVRSSALKYKHEYLPVLPDLTDEDVIGSAYAIGDYEVDPRLGGRDGLASLRARLRERGLRLILDFVPNHVGIDHHWLDTHPEYFIQGTVNDLKNRPLDFFLHTLPDGREMFYGHGRDPMWPGWIDTAQMNVFSPALRKAMAELLLDIASQCDGVRCDMAMLQQDEVFEHTWRGFSGPRLEKPYWRELIPQVKEQHPNFIFIAEVYWGKEFELMQHGFDFCYDKVLYDRIIERNVEKIRQHLYAPLDYQKRLVRFIENHDEQRAYKTLGPKASFPGATLICTLPGMTLLHDGQLDGRTVKLPVQICRQPDETLDTELRDYYMRLLRETRDPVYQHGNWVLFETQRVDRHNDTNQNLLAYGWYYPGRDYRLIVVNLTDTRSQCFVKLGLWDWLEGKRWRLFDVRDGVEYDRHGSEMTEHGLYIDLEPYDSHVFRFEPAVVTA